VAIIRGTSGNDRIRGTAEADEIRAYAGVDLIMGSAGADRIYGGQDDPTGVFGDAIGDTVNYSESNAPVQIDLRQLIQSGGHADGDRLYDIENIVGSRFSDYLHATSDTKLLEGGSGGDTIIGWEGSGTASYAGSNAPVRIDLNVTTQSGGDAAGDQLENIHDVLGSAYGDSILGDTSGNTLQGGDGNDTFQGRLNNDRIDGGEGSDWLRLDTYDSAGTSVDLEDGTAEGTAFYFGNGELDRLISIENVIGTDSADTMWGNSANNEFQGFGSADDLHGEGGKDTLRGGAGDDTLSGGDGSDALFGNDNNDELHGGADADKLDGGDGIDTATYDGSPSGVTVSLVSDQVGAGGDAQGDTLVRIEHLVGSMYDDTLTGDDFGNHLDGGAGNDILDGGNGRDVLTGGSGDDTLAGGFDGARDTYVIDLFNEGTQLDIGNDVITQYEGVDRIQLLYGSSNLTGTLTGTVTQVDNDVVVTIDIAIGSITIFNAQASQFDYLFA
jgi:Ca2+-binding RTX toxin-like protein